MVTSLLIHEKRLSSDSVSVEKPIYNILTFVHPFHDLHPHFVCGLTHLTRRRPSQ